MSHYTVLKTRITDSSALVKALADLDFKEVEVHAVAQHLVGYMGSVRPQTAEVIIRRKHIGWLSNDIGFKRGPHGTFEAIVSDYDRTRFSDTWWQSLLQRYAYHAAKAKLEEKGFTLVNEKKEATGQIRLVLRRVG